MLAILSDVDGERHIALAARVRGKRVGIARAVVSRDRSSVADVAIGVADAHQRQGLGRRLVDALVIEARARGIREFDATIHHANDAALGLARAVAATTSYAAGEVVAQLTIAHDEAACQEPRRRDSAPIVTSLDASAGFR